MINVFPPLPMLWNGATGGTARCRRRSTAFAPSRISPAALLSTCCATPVPSRATTQPARCTTPERLRSPFQPGNDAIVSEKPFFAAIVAVDVQPRLGDCLAEHVLVADHGGHSAQHSVDQAFCLAPVYLQEIRDRRLVSLPQTLDKLIILKVARVHPWLTPLGSSALPLCSVKNSYDSTGRGSSHPLVIESHRVTTTRLRNGAEITSRNG